ncbi:carboxy terminal-processing peptidase [Halioglobus sp. Uisw_031]|uniref:carboxy terminal-processing peptidase n=1 Tax=Halioglobus sp. Uisw_031 TaxID=3230977 RepID=UPI0039EBA35E
MTGRFASLALLLSVCFPAWSIIEYTEQQRDTAVEMVAKLQERHYAKLPYGDELSSQHLDNYVNSLDGGKMFFTAVDLADFEQYRSVMDDQLQEGKLDAGFTIFNRYHQRVQDRLNNVSDTLPETVAAMDFTIDESYAFDMEDRQWAKDQAELDDRWRKQLKNQVLSLKIADKDEDEIVPTLQKRYDRQLQSVTKYNSQDVFQIYANALTELYDPHTNYLSPRSTENFNINMSLSLEGIGAVLQMEDEYTKVSSLVAKGPADKEGELRPSDRIVSVGQGVDGALEDIIGWRLDEVVQLIRGPKDTTVRLEVIPAKSKSTDERKVITIVRNKVKLEEQSAQKKMLEIPAGDEIIKIGVIDIPAFYIDFDAMRRGEKDYKSTTRDVKKLLQELEVDGVDGIIIDLRNNGGGSLQEANELTGLFIEYGPTVQIRHSSRRVWRDGKRLKSPYYEGPLVVLVNRLSASASEIFAGAMQDYERAIIVGDSSFGKGTVQTLVPLTEGQLKITESKFYRISGESTQHRGVIPDVEFPSIYDTTEIGESALDHALRWDQISPVRHINYDDFSSVLPDIQTQFLERSAHNPDFIFLEDQIEMAQAAREMTALPLNEKSRIALRDTQKEKALSIENKRRKAKGEELLTSLQDDEDKDGDGDSHSDASDLDPLAANEIDNEDDVDQEDEEEDVTDDVLLMEAGYVLADALLLKQRRYALHQEEETVH